MGRNWCDYSAFHAAKGNVQSVSKYGLDRIYHFWQKKTSPWGKKWSSGSVGLRVSLVSCLSHVVESTYWDENITFIPLDWSLIPDESWFGERKAKPDGLMRFPCPLSTLYSDLLRGSKLVCCHAIFSSQFPKNSWNLRLFFFLPEKHYLFLYDRNRAGDWGRISWRWSSPPPNSLPY